jgi:2-polyprenyl-6-hydroxyphenyl methylase/3-demethylubiquinone-9 3-methyltransferase
MPEYYREKLSAARLAWFVLQVKAGLVGEIDRGRTGDGRIVCTDGFTATTFTARQFEALAGEIGVDARIVEVDSSSVFCEITPGVPAKKGRV